MCAAANERRKGECLRLDHSPFGKPDAANKGQVDLSDTVDVGDLMPSFHLHEDPTAISIVIGRKGTGKTHALKLLEMKTRSRGNWASLRYVNVDIGAHRAVLQLASSGPGNWERIWRCAVAIAALSRFCCANPDEGARNALVLAETTGEAIKDDWNKYCFDNHQMIDPFAAVQRIVEVCKNSEAVQIYVNDPQLEDLEAFISRIMRNCTPTHFLMDGFDDYEDGNPNIWINIQLGLFWLTRRHETTRKLLRKVFITIAFRDTVLNAARRSEHADRFDYGESIMVLSWTKEAAIVFFRSLLWKVRTKSFWKSTKRLLEAEPERAWLGRTEVSSRRGAVEPVIQYIVRHTRCSPRDLISIGNALARGLNEGSEAAREDPATIIRSVAASAAEVGRLALEAVGRDLLRSGKAPELVELIYNSSLLDEPPQKQLADFFRGALGVVGTEVSTRSRFNEKLGEAITARGGDCQQEIDAIVSAFWSNGVIAMASQRQSDLEWEFVWSDRHQFYKDAPSGNRLIGLHPAFFEVSSIKRSSRGPVF